MGVLGYCPHNKKSQYPDIIFNVCCSDCFIPRPLASPSMRGATPLDVAAASVMDNNELALALREPDLEKVSSYSVPPSTVLWSPLCHG